MTRVNNRTQYKVEGVPDHYAEIYKQLPVYQQEIVDGTENPQSRRNLLDTLARDRDIVPGKMIFVNPAGDGSRGKNSSGGNSGRGNKRYTSQRSLSGTGH